PLPRLRGRDREGACKKIERACHPLPTPPAEVGFIRLRPLNGDRTRVNPSSVASGRGSAPRSRRCQRTHSLHGIPGPLVPAKAGTQIANRERTALDSRFRGNERKSDVGWAKAPTGRRAAPPGRRAHAREKTIMSSRVACPRRSAIVRVGNGEAAVAHPTRAQ